MADEEFFPADLIIVKSSDPEGSLYIETKSLDGETNLKNKTAVAETNRALGSRDEEVRLIDGKITCEPPNNSIYKFDGTMSTSGAQVALSAENMVLRGSKLRNTAHVYGIVVFSGHDTKIMRNSAKAKYKFSKLEKYSNKAIALVLMTQFFMSLIASTFGTAWVYNNCFQGSSEQDDDIIRGAYYLKFTRSNTSFLLEFI